MRSSVFDRVSEAADESDAGMKPSREATLTPGDERVAAHSATGASPMTDAHATEEPDEARRAPRLSHQSPLRAMRSDAWTIVGWTFVAFVLRWLFLRCFEYVISPDGVAYVTLGRNIVAGDFREGLSAYYPPLYPLLVGLSTLIFREPELGGRMVSVIAGSLLVVPVFLLIREWYGLRAARPGAALVALHPLLIYYSTTLLTESTYTLFFTCGVCAGWTALAGAKVRAHLLAGVLFGACYLLKPEAAGFLMLLLVPTLGMKFFKTGRSWRAAAANASALVAGFLLLALPYLVYVHAVTGAWMLSEKFAGHLWQGARAPGDVLPPPAAATFVPDLTTAVVQLTKALRSEFEVFNLIFPTAFTLLAGLGLFRAAWTRARVAREMYLACFIAATVAGYAVTLPNIRFLVPLLPLLLCWVVKGIFEFEAWTVATARRLAVRHRVVTVARKMVVPLVVAALLASLLPLCVYLMRGDKWSDYHGQKRAALWIKEQTAGRAPVVMATVPVAAFYAQGRHVALTDEGYEKLVERARREGVDYVVVNERNVKQMSLRTLLDEQVRHDELRLAHTLADAPGHRILVYKLAGDAEANSGEGARQTAVTGR
jgi:4-amino-4-deoxy-L-arabinose transferase-like glycosyltransferase